MTCRKFKFNVISFCSQVYFSILALKIEISPKSPQIKNMYIRKEDTNQGISDQTEFLFSYVEQFIDKPATSQNS